MEYLVMECHTSYAVVLDQSGGFRKVANLGYEVGQELDRVVEFRQEKKPLLRWTPLLSAAACLCILITGVWQMVLLSMGTVLLQINPQVRLSVNRMERVITAEAVNPDGAKILFEYNAFGKTVEQVAQELSDRAANMGYLTDGGQVRLTVESQDPEWKAATEQRLESVCVHDAQNVTVIIAHDDDCDEDDGDDFDDHEDADEDEPDEDDHEDDADDHNGSGHGGANHRHGQDDEDDEDDQED